MTHPVSPTQYTDNAQATLSSSIPKQRNRDNHLDQAKLVGFQAAVKSIEALNQPTLVILDFDETLFLRNSTEEYLNTLRPQVLGATFLLVLDKLKPWSFLPPAIGGKESRDWVRVLLATLLFPWTVLLWRRRVADLIRTYENYELSQAVNNNPQLRPMIATRGFEFIVKPMAQYLSIPIGQVVGCRFFKGGLDRQKGKEELLLDHLDLATLRQSALVTDSADDASLLALVKYPYWVQWPEAEYVPAMSEAYLPFLYLERVKRPGTRFTLRVIGKNHFLSLLLAYTWLSPSPLIHGLGIGFLVVSFWCIYEIGYFENDRIAENYEEKPVLSENYLKYKSRMSRMDIRQPWIVAAIFGLLGVILTTLGNQNYQLSANLQSLTVGVDYQALALVFTLWTGALVVTRLLYRGYNYMDEKTRIWIYPLLQVSKYFSFLVVASTNLVGFVLLTAQIFVDWVPYIIYRCGGQKERLEEQILRLCVFVLLGVGLTLALGQGGRLLTWQFGVILGWLMLRTRPQFKSLLENAHFVYKK